MSDRFVLLVQLWIHPGQEAAFEDSLAGRHVHVGRGAAVAGTVLGDKTVVTDYSRL